MQRLVLVIIVAGLLVAVLQILIHRVFKGHTFYKYILSIILLLLTIVCVIKAEWFSSGMEGLAYLVTAIIAAGIFVISLIAGISIDLASKYRKSKKNRSP